MIKLGSLSQHLAIAAATVVLWSAAAATAHSQTKPLAIRGTGAAPLGLPLPGQAPRPHWAVGEALHLGRYYSEGSIQTDSASIDPASGLITGTFESGSPLSFRAANGDSLVMHTTAPGSFVLTILGVTSGGAIVVQGAFSADFGVLPNLSTGRFSGATGTWTMFASTDPFVLGSNDPVTFSWQGVGQLTSHK